MGCAIGLAHRDKAVIGSPIVSVLTPSFNQSRWLGYNLKSVAAQTYPFVEHVVMDGGSTDGSIDLLARAGQNVFWSSGPDRGQSHALNKAFARSRGEVIGWINSDDAYFDREAVEYAVDVFARHPEIDVVYGHAALVNRDNLVLQVTWAPAFSYRLLRFHNFIIQPTVFLRRTALQSGFLDEAFHSCMDKELWLRLASAGHRFWRADRVLAIDRHYPERKAVTRLDLSTAELLRLKELYDLPAGISHRVRLKALTVGLRVPGAGVAARIHGAELAFNGDWDEKWRFLRRQLGVRRSKMPGCAPLKAPRLS
jgi:glycosyltransferase involved in cell wall biosynthesis